MYSLTFSGSIRPRLRRTIRRGRLKNSMSFILGTGSFSAGGTYINFLTGRPFSRCSSTSGDVFDLELLVKDAVRLDHEDRPPLAESVAARGDHEDLVLEVPLPDLLFEGLFDLKGVAGDASRPGANQ